MRFGGFPAAAFDFYAGLRPDNSRTYWAAHRDVYEDSVRAPLAALLDDLAGEFGGEVSLLRPFRDVRFADYALTGQRMRQISARLLQLATYRDMQALSRGIKGAATADEESMAAFLDQLRGRYGGAAGYLTAHGLSGGELAALRATLVES